VRLHDREGRPRDIAAFTAPVRTTSGAIEAVVVCWLDITERKHDEQELEYLATHDPLTGLPNRRVFEASLAQTVERAARGRHSALFLIDIDNFKLVNETAGHTAGDHILSGIAGVMNDALRPGDLLARFGGDEFTALVFDVTISEAKAVAARLVTGVAGSRITYAEHAFDPTISVGVCAIDGSSDSSEVLRHADTALFSAKDLGRNRVILFEDDRVVEFVLAGRWASRIKDAIADERLALAFQPIVSLDDGRPQFFEALVRMRGEEGEVIPPAAFLPAAEQLGLMSQIDAWVVREALAHLREQSNLCLFVNLSAPSFEDDALLDLIESELDGIEPGRVCFEITEATALKSRPRAARRLHALKRLGCLLALDDFGSGYSSFRRLRDLPVDFLKIDGSLTREIATDPKSRAVVQGILQLGRALGVEVIAEAVETAAVATLLPELGIHYGQGFTWGHPRVVERPGRHAAPSALPRAS
jgi:diguanylate cyclase (GGDEF)-like protein